MMKAVLCLVFSLLVLSVSSISVKRSFDPVIKTATIIETKDITDPDFVIPCPVKPTEETCKFLCLFSSATIGDLTDAFCVLF
jgi:hypothetical protein